MHEGDPNWVHEDRCYGQNVIEGRCDSFGNVHLVNYGSCENGCDDGACLAGDSGQGAGGSGEGFGQEGAGQNGAGLGDQIKTQSSLRQKLSNFFRNTFNAIRMK